MKINLNILTFSFLIFLTSTCCMADQSKYIESTKLSEFDEIMITLYGINKFEYGFNQDVLIKKDSVPIISCFPILVSKDSNTSSDSIKYFFIWKKDGAQIGSNNYHYIINSLIYKKNKLLYGGFENVWFDFRKYNYKQDTSLFEMVRKNKNKLVNPWLLKVFPKMNLQE